MCIFPSHFVKSNKQTCHTVISYSRCYNVSLTLLPAGLARSSCARWDLIGCWCSWRNTFTQAQWLWHFGYLWCCWAIRASSLALKRVCAEEAGSSTPIRCSLIKSAPCSVSNVTRSYRTVLFYQSCISCTGLHFYDTVLIPIQIYLNSTFPLYKYLYI